MLSVRKFRKIILNLTLVKKKINELSKIATNQSLNLSPTVSTLGLFYCWQLKQIPFTTTSISFTAYPLLILISGTITSSRQSVLPHFRQIK